MNFTVDDILNYCGQDAYVEGKSCASFDDFFKVFVQDNAIFGLYRGSVGTYRVNIVFDGNSPTYSRCTCPAMGQYDAVCKHIAALMVLWQKSPREFTKLDSWQMLLAKYDKEALLELVKHLASRSIDMTSTLYEELKGAPLIEDEDMYDGEDEW
jgi:hypothetical protein